MVRSDTEQQWNQAFKEAKSLLRDHPTKIKKLTEIYKRPPYCAEYYINQLDTNLLLFGSTSAELIIPL